MGTPFSLNITWDENTLTGLSHSKLMNDLMRRMGNQHKVQHLPKHFQACPETSVGGAYGYAARTLRWQKRKQREGRPLQANVYTGRLAAEVMFSSTVTATQYRTRVRAKGYFPMRDSQRKEIEAVSGPERTWLAKEAGKDYAKRSKSNEYRKKRHRKL